MENYNNNRDRDRHKDRIRDTQIQRNRCKRDRTQPMVMRTDRKTAGKVRQTTKHRMERQREKKTCIHRENERDTETDNT